MSSVSARVPSHPRDHDLLLGLLMSDEVQGVQELDDSLVFFFAEESVEEVKFDFEMRARPLATGPLTWEVIQDRNWNAEWEKTIKPIRAGRFYIRPSWNDDPAPEGTIELIIDPKMSFGTGYHESTRLMLNAVPDMVAQEDYVLDAGTGTGVLAFAALKSGARQADAFDIDPICKENAEENAELNGVSDRFGMWVGTEKGIPDRTYDVIMANINRETLRAMLPELLRHLEDGGRLGLAGLLVSDREIMLRELASCQVVAVRESTEGDWWSVWATRPEKPGRA